MDEISKCKRKVVCTFFIISSDRITNLGNSDKSVNMISFKEHSEFERKEGNILKPSHAFPS